MFFLFFFHVFPFSSHFVGVSTVPLKQNQNKHEDDDDKKNIKTFFFKYTGTAIQTTICDEKKLERLVVELNDTWAHSIVSIFQDRIFYHFSIKNNWSCLFLNFCEKMSNEDNRQRETNTKYSENHMNFIRWVNRTFNISLVLHEDPRRSRSLCRYGLWNVYRGWFQTPRTFFISCCDAFRCQELIRVSIQVTDKVHEKFYGLAGNLHVWTKEQDIAKGVMK